MDDSIVIDAERLAELLRALPPVPDGWEEAAQALPAARAGLDALVARATADAAFRQRVLADLEDALTRADLPPDARTIELLRRRLSG